MSTFSLSLLVLFAITLTTGMVIKIILVKMRKDLEGFHGFEHKEDSQQSPTDDWGLL